MTEFNSGRGGRDDDIVDLEAQPVTRLETVQKDPLESL